MNDEIKISDEARECPHCHGSLERYEDPLAVKLLHQRDAEIRELEHVVIMHLLGDFLCEAKTHEAAMFEVLRKKGKMRTDKHGQMAETPKETKGEQQ